MAPVGEVASGEILLIDDDPDVRNTLHELLAELGYTVNAAENAAAGLKLLERTNPDIVILDFAMPDVNGAEAAKAIRINHRDADPFFSGFAHRALSDGAALPDPA